MYIVILQSKAEKFLKKLPKDIQKRIIEKLKELKEKPEMGVPLTANLTGLWKLRIGDYRAIYVIRKSELTIFVIRIGHRKNIYHEKT